MSSNRESRCYFIPTWKDKRFSIARYIFPFFFIFHSQNERIARAAFGIPRPSFRLRVYRGDFADLVAEMSIDASLHVNVVYIRRGARGFYRVTV